MTAGPTTLRPLSMNHKTVTSWTVAELVDGCARAGIEAVGLWREPVAETGLARAAKLISDAGLRVSSLCRGGFFTAADDADFRVALDDNRRAIDEAAALGAPCLVLVAGGLAPGSRDLLGARQRVAEALAALGPHAVAAGVLLGVEPLHPMFCADRAVVSTLGQALDLAEAVPGVGVVVDSYHVWWDPAVEAQIARAGERIVSYQVCDWLTPLPADVLLGRGVMGDGHIDFAPLTAAVLATGYAGDIEVEIFNADIWAEDPATVVPRIISSYQRHFGG
jgi:sugar phosphate isomerase/epimerase